LFLFNAFAIDVILLACRGVFFSSHVQIMRIIVSWLPSRILGPVAADFSFYELSVSFLFPLFSCFFSYIKSNQIRQIALSL